MAAELTKRVQGKPEQRRLQVTLGDVIKTELPYFDVCISNTPYQVQFSPPLPFLPEKKPPLFETPFFPPVAKLNLNATDFLTPHFQTSCNEPGPPNLYSHVSARIRNAPLCQTRR